MTKVSEEDYPYLGVQLKDISENMVTNYGMPAGILVYYVEENSPAQVAGIMNNDVITSFDGHTVRTYEDLNQLLPALCGRNDSNVDGQPYGAWLLSGTDGGSHAWLPRGSYILRRHALRMITGRDSHTTMKFLRTITGRIVIVGTMIAIQVVWFLLLCISLRIIRWGSTLR